MRNKSLQIFIDKINEKYNKNEIKIIFDIGSRDCYESIDLALEYPSAKVYAFECHPESIIKCFNNSKEYNNIEVVPKAVNEFNGKCIFWMIDPEKTKTTWEDGNPGASSLFKANGAYDYVEKYVQKEIEVDCIRLDTFCKLNNIANVDLIHMDLQGAELIAFKSLGDLIKTVKGIHTETEIRPIYTNQATFHDLNHYLKQYNFYHAYGLIDPSLFGTDVIFLKL